MDDIYKYPKHDEYEFLYKRFFARPVTELINLAGIKDNDKALDLCCGGGRISFAAKQAAKNVSVLAIDAEKDMIPAEDFKKQGIKWLVQTVNSFLFGCYLDDEYSNTFNAVFCQQSITYWFKDSEYNIQIIRDIMAPGGRFVFNTFAVKPSSKPIIKHYELDGHKYVEISRLRENGKIHHIQVADEMMHETEFDWVPKEEFLEKLKPYFKTEIRSDGKTDIYVCTARE